MAEGFLSRLWADVDRMTDPLLQVRRLSARCDTLRDEVAATGALPGEFRVVMLYRRNGRARGEQGVIPPDLVPEIR
jgi:hypothetical protein